jgi:hypothetical protein
MTNAAIVHAAPHFVAAAHHGARPPIPLHIERLLDTIFLYLSRVNKDKELANQTDREKLYSEHEQQRSEQESGSVGELRIAQYSLHDEIRNDGAADPGDAETQQPKESQRLLRELDQEENREDV